MEKAFVMLLSVGKQTISDIPLIIQILHMIQFNVRNSTPGIIDRETNSM